MPRIDPLSLLKCLSVLLSPNGGIKSKEEVIRLANLMTKFSKKLVSKCIYIQILKSSSPDLLDQFMAAGGWGLIHVWLSDGIQYKNYALIEELLELLLLCPVNVERLKSNNCPKLIKGLSKNSHVGVRNLASRLVEQWLKMVKGEALNASQASESPGSSHSYVSETSTYNSHASVGSVINHNASENVTSNQISDPAIDPIPQNSIAQPIGTQHQINNVSPKAASQSPNNILEKSQPTPKSTSPIYKITIRDGKQVLTQMQTDASNINLAANVNVSTTDINGDIVDSAVSRDNENQKLVQESENNFETVNHDELSKNVSSEVNEVVLKSDFDTDVCMTDSVNKDKKDEKSENNKSISNKENRDKKEDKKSASSHSSDKKSSSSSKSSSKHSSSSSKHSSSKHSSSSQRSSSKSSSSSRDKSSRDKEKDKHHSGSSSKSSSSKSKSDRDKDRDKEKEKVKKDQAEKDKATLEKLQSQTLSTKMLKIPKKKADEEKAGDSPSRKSSSDSKDSFKENKEKSEIKKPISVPEKKNISMSIENRKNTQDSNSRPKTVKTFNSKFRSTGLEEEIKPIPSRGAKKVASLPDKKVLPPKLSLKRSSPNRDSGSTAEKKPKLSLESPTTPPSDEKKGGIKLIPPKPKLVFLQESDMFMDALTASTKSKEPRKKKRRTSISKDGKDEPKKQDNDHNHRDGSSSPMSPDRHKDHDDKPMLASKPTLNFYQDTLETDEEKCKVKQEDTSLEEMDTEPIRVKKDNDDGGSRTPTPENDFYDEKSSGSPEDPAAAVSEALKKEPHDTIESRPIGVLKSVLLLQKRKGPKKSLKWKTDLESVRYFELDETERVNVTKTFTDMKQMEKMNEREAFQMARKLSSEDVMEEKTIWKPLIPIDLPPPLVEPGKDSQEKNIQYAREKGILQALYFNRSMIPDCAAEPDEERHHVFTEPKIIPLDDLTGNKESEKDYSNVPWPEPKPQLPAPAPTMQATYFQTFRPNQQPMMPSMTTQPPIASIPQKAMLNSMPPMVPEVAQAMPTPAVSGGGWRTGDGKLVVPDPNLSTMPPMTNNYPANMENPSMVPPNMMTPPPQLYSNEGYLMAPDEMGFNNFQGPPGPGMYGPSGPGGPPGPPFQGPRPPMHGNRGRGGPGWFRGGPPRGMPWRGGWRGNAKQPPLCRQFSKNGYCRVGDKCQFAHPGVNCPPY